MKLTLIITALLTSVASSAILLDFTGLTSPTGVTAIDISSPQTFDLSSLDPSLAGVTVTLSSSGSFTGTPGTVGGGSQFANGVLAGNSNIISLTFSQALDFEVDMVSNHFVAGAAGGTAEINVLTMTGGTWDNTSYAETGGSTAGPQTAFSSGDSVFTAGPLSTDGTSASGSSSNVEWVVAGSGTGFDFSNEYVNPDDATATAQNAFTVCITGVQPVPEPSSTVLLGLASLALFSRRKR